jgi:hypothetical protein
MVETAMDDIGREAASTLLARQQRNGRLYDVPQIGELVRQHNVQRPYTVKKLKKG